MQSLGFGARLGLAFGLFFKILADGVFGRRVQSALDTDDGPGQVQPNQDVLEPESPAQTPEPVVDLVALDDARERGALQLLGALQREGRLVDFLMEELDGASDADIGAAARVVHGGCGKAMKGYFTIEPVWPGEDGSSVTVDEGFDPQRVQLTGNVVGSPPFEGTLQHHGWRANQSDLPSLSDTQDPAIIAPAEVEL